MEAVDIELTDFEQSKKLKRNGAQQTNKIAYYQNSTGELFFTRELCTTAKDFHKQFTAAYTESDINKILPIRVEVNNSSLFLYAEFSNAGCEAGYGSSTMVRNPKLNVTCPTEFEAKLKLLEKLFKNKLIKL